jgi:hypothetical protein
VTTMTYTGKLQVVDCGVCHIPFAMPAELYRQLQDADDDGTFWCPAGHRLHFTDPTGKQLRRQLAAAQESARAARAARTAAEDQAAAAERSARAYRGHATRLRKRVAAGACPAGCHLTFTSLAEHMAAEHPGFESEEPADA